MAGLIHYQPVTGPVWREPVASRMQWLPQGQPLAARSLPYALRGSYTVAAVSVDPALLSWQPVDRPVGRALGRGRLDPTVFPIQFGAPVAFDPQNLEWIPQGTPPRLPVELRRLGDFVQPPFDALYKSEQLGWLSSAAYLGRSLPRGTLDLTVFPVQFAAPAFDPQNLEWIPKGTPPRTILEVREASDLVQPPFDALYKAEGLQWTPKGTYPQLPVERRILGDFAQPPFGSLYRPEGLQWLFEGQLSVRGIPYPLQGAWVIDPTPIVTVAFDPQFFPFQATDIVLARSLPSTIQSGYATPPLPPGPDVIPPVPDTGLGGSSAVHPRRRVVYEKGDKRKPKTFIDRIGEPFLPLEETPEPVPDAAAAGALPVHTAPVKAALAARLPAPLPPTIATPLVIRPLDDDEDDDLLLLS